MVLSVMISCLSEKARMMLLNVVFVEACIVLSEGVRSRVLRAMEVAYIQVRTKQ